MDAVRQLACCSRALGQEQDILSILLTGLSYGVPSGELCCDLGRCFMEQNQYAIAAYWFRQALLSEKSAASGAFIQEECYGFYPAISLCVCYDRLGDLENGRRTDAKRLANSTTRPTLSAVPGDLSLCMPKRQLDNIIETLHALDRIAPGTANYDTLLYGAEVKFYSARLKLSEELETAIPNFFAAGDGAGVTRGLAQAGASGVQAARAILKRLS